MEWERKGKAPAVYDESAQIRKSVSGAIASGLRGRERRWRQLGGDVRRWRRSIRKDVSTSSEMVHKSENACGGDIAQSTKVTEGKEIPCGKGASPLLGGRKVAWADQAGRPLTRFCRFERDILSGWDVQVHDRVGASELATKGEKVTRGRSYKEVLLQPCAHSRATSGAKRKTSVSAPRRGSGRVGCFRCLASNHWSRQCRDPVRCRKC